MSKVAVITDSISCVPMDFAKEYGVTFVTHGLTIDGKPYRDMFDISPSQFWDGFKAMKEFTTGVPPIDDFAKAYRELSKNYEGVVCIHVSSKLTGMCEVAKQAKDIYQTENPKFKVEIVDTKTAAGAEGFVVMEAAKTAKTGKTIAEVVAAAQNMVPRVKFFCSMDTLKYLIRSGRAPKTAYMGELLQIKPIIGMLNGCGEVENLGRARGKDKAMQRMVEMIQDNVDVNKPLHINVHYTASIADGEKLRDMVTSKYKCTEVLFTPYSPIMSGHVGPVIAVAFYS